jgi:hypothetical protein
MTASIDEIAPQVAAAAQVARTASAAANHDMIRGLADAATRIGKGGPPDRRHRHPDQSADHLLNIMEKDQVFNVDLPVP